MTIVGDRVGGCLGPKTFSCVLRRQRPGDIALSPWNKIRSAGRVEAHRGTLSKTAH